MQFTIHAKKIFIVNSAIVGCFLVGNLVGIALKYLPEEPLVKNYTRFNLDMEANLPTYFSTLVLLASGVLLAVVAAHKRHAGKPYFYHWALLALFFVGMSVDETISLHELASRPLRAMLQVDGVMHHAWVIPGLLFVAVIAIAYTGFLFALPIKIRVQFIAAACIYLAGAIGMEMVGSWHLSWHGEENSTYGLITIVEETLELSGAVLFLYAVMEYLRREDDTIVLRLQ